MAVFEHQPLVCLDLEVAAGQLNDVEAALLRQGNSKPT